MNVETNDMDKCEVALAGLKNVYDPEVGLNVVDLGLIYQVNFLQDPKKVICLMTLTTEFCPMGESIVSDVTQSLQFDFEKYEVEVNLTFDPPWDYSCISDEGREYLGR